MRRTPRTNIVESLEQVLASSGVGDSSSTLFIMSLALRSTEGGSVPVDHKSVRPSYNEAAGAEAGELVSAASAGG